MMSTVAYSTPEAEQVALSFGMRSSGSPGMLMWEKLSGQAPVVIDNKSPKDLLALPHTLVVHSDNTATISIARTGNNPTMRHMGRTHGVSLTWMIIELKGK